MVGSIQLSVKSLNIGDIQGPHDLRAPMSEAPHKSDLI